jgi:ssDNA-binding Zn-finger/Zn-ribbon topoisomerase 1
VSLESIIKGWTGELKTSITQGLFLDSKQYHVFNNVLIQSDSDSTQIDHVIVSKYGIFVVETKNKNHWIFGNEFDDYWTQVIYNEKIRFQNPLRQNYKHTKSLAGILSINHDKMHSVVVIWGGCEFKNHMPLSVVNTFMQYISFIKSKKQVLLSDQEIERALITLKGIKDGTSFFDGVNHVRSLQAKHSDVMVCPKCRGRLVERVAHTGEKRGESFLGCSNYPRCRYTRDG